MREKPLILIADDKEEFREIISAKLGAAGFDCVTVKSGAEAVQKAPELLPDLILMDINMPPGINGVEAALSVRENPATKATNIAFLTSANHPWPGISGGDNEMISKELGMQGFFDKANVDEMAEKMKIAFRMIGEPPKPPAAE